MGDIVGMPLPNGRACQIASEQEVERLRKASPILLGALRRCELDLLAEQSGKPVRAAGQRLEDVQNAIKAAGQ